MDSHSHTHTCTHTRAHTHVCAWGRQSTHTARTHTQRHTCTSSVVGRKDQTIISTEHIGQSFDIRGMSESCYSHTHTYTQTGSYCLQHQTTKHSSFLLTFIIRSSSEANLSHPIPALFNTTKQIGSMKEALDSARALKNNYRETASGGIWDKKLPHCFKEWGC